MDTPVSPNAGMSRGAKRRRLHAEVTRPPPRLPDCLATRQVRDMRAPTRLSPLNDHHVACHSHPHFSFLRPACLSMAFSVPCGMSRLGFPATVTVPGLLVCLYCRWLPRVRASSHPSNALQLNGKGERTQEAYTRAGRMLSTFYRKPPDEIAEPELGTSFLRRRNVEPLVAEHEAHRLLRHSVLLRARAAAHLAPRRHPALEEPGASAGDPEPRGGAGGPAVRADAP